MNTVVSLIAPITEPIYQLTSIAPAVTPEGTEGIWHRYVITQGGKDITGLRCGSHAEVDITVRKMVESLNERSTGKNAKKAKAAVVKSPPSDVSNI